MKRPHNVYRYFNHWQASDARGYSVRCIKKGKRWSAFCHGGIYAANTLTKLAELIFKGTPCK